jgi:hypothetical protein
MVSRSSEPILSLFPRQGTSQSAGYDLFRSFFNTIILPDSEISEIKLKYFFSIEEKTIP